MGSSASVADNGLVACGRCGLRVPAGELDDHKYAHQLHEAEAQTARSEFLAHTVANMLAASGLVDSRSDGRSGRGASRSGAGVGAGSSGGGSTGGGSTGGGSTADSASRGRSGSSDSSRRGSGRGSDERGNPGAGFLFRAGGPGPPSLNLLSSSGENPAEDFFRQVVPALMAMMTGGDAEGAGQNSSGEGAQEPQSSRPRPLDRLYREALPVSQWAPPDAGQQARMQRAAPRQSPDNMSCMVCLEAFKQGELVCRLPCLHVYHSKCINDWFDRSERCPICKVSVVEALTGRQSDADGE